MDIQEEWRAVADTNYEISNTGRLRHSKTKHIKKTYIINGYENSSFKHKDMKQHTHKIHRLVAKAFLPCIPGKDKVNHKDENKLNNHLSNLEWVDDKENMRHYYKTRKNRNVRVKLLISDGDIEEEFESIGEAARTFGLDTTTMWGYSLAGKFQIYTIKRIPITIDESGTPRESNPL